MRVPTICFLSDDIHFSLLLYCIHLHMNKPHGYCQIQYQAYHHHTAAVQDYIHYADNSNDDGSLLHLCRMPLPVLWSE